MGRFLVLAVAAATVLMQLVMSAGAASLRVAPVMLDLKGPTAASTIRVWNEAQRPLNVQIRVFRWFQSNGEDHYEATDSVVASPPITTLRPGGENLIRIVRVSKRPVQEEESYRVMIDELPDQSRRQAGTVVFVVRHSIPVFFSSLDAGRASPSWSVERRRGGYLVAVRNNGAVRFRIANLTLSSRGGAIVRRNGLVGYVLGNSTASWFFPSKSQAKDGSVAIAAESEEGHFDATAQLAGG